MFSFKTSTVIQTYQINQVIESVFIRTVWETLNQLLSHRWKRHRLLYSVNLTKFHSHYCLNGRYIWLLTVDYYRGSSRPPALYLYLEKCLWWNRRIEIELLINRHKKKGFNQFDVNGISRFGSYTGQLGYRRHSRLICTSMNFHVKWIFWKRILEIMSIYICWI